MFVRQILCAIALSAAVIVPATAEDAMGNMSMKTMKGGEVVAIGPDGHMGSMTMSDHAMMDNMMKVASPMDHCMMFMTGSDGKTYAVDTSSDDAMKECEKIAK